MNHIIWKVYIIVTHQTKIVTAENIWPKLNFIHNWRMGSEGAGRNMRERRKIMEPWRKKRLLKGGRRESVLSEQDRRGSETAGNFIAAIELYLTILQPLCFPAIAN